MGRLVFLGALAALGLSVGNDVHVARVGGGPPTAGRAWVVKLAVRPTSFSGRIRIVATGPRRITARAHRAHGAYHARIVFPTTGAWTLTARAGTALSRLGSVRVRPAPLVFDQPTGVASRPDGSLLVVEFGRRRLLRVDSATARATQLAKLLKPWGVARAPSGSVYVSDLGWLKRIDPGRAPEVVATADPGVEVGPVAVAPDGDVFYATVSAVYRLAHGAGPPERLAPGTTFVGSHGLAVAGDGSLLASDTDENVIKRIDEAGPVTTFAVIGHPRGIAVAPDGSVYVAAADEHRIVHLGPSGRRLGVVGPRFDDVYALTVAPDGTVYAIDIGAGVIRRLAPSP